MNATLLLAAALSTTEIRAEMQTVESRLVALGYDKVAGAASALPIPNVIISDRLPAASELSTGLRVIALRSEPAACFTVRLDYELANYLVISRYGDASEKAAQEIADGYEPFSPNCMKPPTDGTLGALRGSFSQ